MKFKVYRESVKMINLDFQGSGKTSRMLDEITKESFNFIKDMSSIRQNGSIFGNSWICPQFPLCVVELTMEDRIKLLEEVLTFSRSDELGLDSAGMELFGNMVRETPDNLHDTKVLVLSMYYWFVLLKQWIIMNY